MRIAVVTGASSGIGREFVIQIEKKYKELDEIWVIARRENRLQELEGLCKTKIRRISGDLEGHVLFEQVQELLKMHQPNIRMLVNAAGFGRTGSVEDISLEDLNLQARMVDVNCTALTKMTCICLPYLNEGSRIINIASAAAFCPQTGFSVYAATKAYVLSFSRSLAQELRKKKIYVTAVCPGPVKTEFFEVAGGASNAIKKLMMAEPDAVVRQALKDAIKGNEISIYGISMKVTKMVSKVLPQKMIIYIMDKIQ